jgi:hypothetical protein
MNSPSFTTIPGTISRNSLKMRQEISKEVDIKPYFRLNLTLFYSWQKVWLKEKVKRLFPGMNNCVTLSIIIQGGRHPDSLGCFLFFKTYLRFSCNIIFIRLNLNEIDFI